jgi:hypothetical protein
VLVRGRGLALGLFVILGLTLILVNVRPAWALTITPTSPTAGVPFTITQGIVAGPPVLYILSGFLAPSCVGTVVYGPITMGDGHATVTVPGLPAGQYSTYITYDSSGCVEFTVMPAATPPPIPEYPLGLAVLVIFMIIGYSLIRRRTRSIYP